MNHVRFENKIEIVIVIKIMHYQPYTGGRARDSAEGERQVPGRGGEEEGRQEQAREEARRQGSF